MKILQIAGIACATLMAGSAAPAMDLRGGDLSLSFSRFEDDLIGPNTRLTFAKYALQGSAEFDISPLFGVQFDASYFDFNASDISENSFGLHGVYHMANGGALGAFYTRDSLLNEHVNYYGVEGRGSFGLVDGEAYLGTAELDGDDATILGIRADYAIQPQFSLGLSYDHANFDGASEATQFGFGLEYAPTYSLRLSGELGWTDVTLLGGSADDLYIKLGASFVFGPEEGASFGRRGLLDRLPGL